MEPKIENLTSRMAALMGRLRREMNGSVAESMQRAGLRGMLNYGVSIPTVRTIAREVGRDHAFARFLYKQQVRELRLAAASIADPERLTLEEAEEWVLEAGSWEIVDEAAMSLLARADERLHMEMTARWLMGENETTCYAALMTLSRSSLPAEIVLPALCDALERFSQKGRVARAALAYSTFHYSSMFPDMLPDTESGNFVKQELSDLFG